MGWQEHVEQLLFGGETIIDGTSGHEAGIVVTSHRVLVFREEAADAPNFRAIHRPNVIGLDREESGAEEYLAAGAKWLVLGVVLTIAGVVLDFEGLAVDPSGGAEAGELGIGWITGVFSIFGTFFAALDTLLLFVGLLVVFVGLGLLGWYWTTRTETLTVAVAGGEDVVVPASGFSSRAVRSIGEAIEPPVADDSSDSTR